MSRSVRLTFVNGYPSLDPLESLRVRRGLVEEAPSHLCWGEGSVLWKRELRIYCHAAIGINVIPSRAHFMEGPVRHSGNFAYFVTDEMERA